MTVSAGPKTWSPLQAAPICRVFVSTTAASSPDGKDQVQRSSPRDLATVNWKHEPRLQVDSWTLESGSTPHSCVVTVAGNKAATGPLVTDFGMVWGVDQNNLGEELEVVMRPDGLYWFDDLMVIAYEPDDTDQATPTGQVVFRGYIADVWEEFETGLPKIRALGPRWMMEGSQVHGANVWDEINKVYVWVPGILPIFNRDGKPDRAADEDVTGSVAATEPAFTHVGGVTGEYHLRGHIWNYIRKHWQESPKSSVVQPLSGWLDVPQLSAEGMGAGMFTVQDDETEGGTNQNAPLHAALHGKGLNKTFAALARHRSDYDITVRPDAAKSLLILYGTGLNTIESSQRRVTLRRGEISSSITAAAASGGQPEIFGGNLGYTVRNAYTRLRCYGAMQELDVSFDTVASSLAEGWISGDQTTYNAADRDNDDAMIVPSVYRRYIIPSDLNFVDDYRMAIHLLRSGALGSTLNSEDDETAATGQSVRVRAQAFYSTDGGSNWKEVTAPFTVQTDTLAVEFPHAARYGDKTRFTWNGTRGTPTSYDIRVTLKMTIDERLMVTAGSEPAGWPARELIKVDDAYKYQVRRKCHLRTDNGNPVDADTLPGSVVHDGGDMCDPETGTDTDDLIKDDTDRLRAVASALRSQLARPKLAGKLRLNGVRADMFPGDYLEKITGGGGAGKVGVKRSDWPVKAVIRRVEVDATEQGQGTTISLEAD